MARLEGGIFSRPRGKTGGIVFGAARTREGKAVTSRLLVRPSNPRTPAQQLQRRKFDRTLNTVRSWGPGLYQDYFNRTIGQLAGFQSLESILLGAFKNDGSFEAPADTRTGSAFGWNDGSLDVGDAVNDKTYLDVNRGSGQYPTGTRLHGFFVSSETGDWNDEDSIVRTYKDSVLQSEDTTLHLEFDIPDDASGTFLFGCFVEYPANSPSPRSATRWITASHGTIQDMKNNG